MLELKLNKPLVVFDIEATGVTTRADRIVELAIVKLMPDGSHSSRTWRINPEMPIPLEAINIHGITNEDVVDCPLFTEVAKEIYQFIKDCDLCGYNILRFDIPMLEEEFIRAGIQVDFKDCKVIDVQRIFHKREPRDLTAALSFYCGEMHVDAHGAESDVRATISVLKGQFKKYHDLPKDIDTLDKYCDFRNSDWVDKTGKFKWVNNEVVLNFGKRKGELLRDIINKDTGFIKWMLRSDFPRDVHKIIRNALENKWPEKT